jgi:hypothetical protein
MKLKAVSVLWNLSNNDEIRDYLYEDEETFEVYFLHFKLLDHDRITP